MSQIKTAFQNESENRAKREVTQKRILYGSDKVFPVGLPVKSSVFYQKGEGSFSFSATCKVLLVKIMALFPSPPPPPPDQPYHHVN